jgi:hypothetical protein
VSCLEREEEREFSGEILAPARQTATGDNQWLFELSVKLGGELRIYELRQRFGFNCNQFFTLGEQIIKVGIDFVEYS